MMEQKAQKLLSTREVAALWGLNANTLAIWRVQGVGPNFVKLGRAVRYDPAELERFFSERRRANTSESQQ